MKANREYRYVPFEVRQNEEGLTVLEGTVIRYGDRADIGGWFTEEFRAGWMENTADVKWANRMHVRSAPLATSDTPYLNIDDNGERMFASLTLPDTTYGRDVAVEISAERRLLRGFSVEFLTTEDQYDYKRDHRIVVKGRMFGFGVVDRPAYPDSVAQVKRALEYREYYGLSVPAPEPQTNPTPEPVAVRHYFVV